MVETREYNAVFRRKIIQSYFNVLINSTNEPVVEGETLDVDTLVEETEGLSDTQDITLEVGNTQYDIQNVSLNANGDTNITLSWTTQQGDDGTYTITVSSEDSVDTTDIEVLKQAEFDVGIDSTNSPVDEGETLNVNTSVDNLGDVSDTQDITLDIPQGTQVDVQSVTLNGNGTTTITLSWQTQSGDAGDYTAEVASEDDTDTATITVDPAALIWDATDLDNGTDTGVVHENTANTDYNSDSVIRKGDPTGAPLYANDLEAWYPLQEPSGSTLVDFSGNNYDGTYNGVTLGGGTPLTGIPTHSWDGNDDYADTGQKFQYIHEGNFTISFWIWIPSDISSRAYLFDTGAGSQSNNGGYAVSIYDSTEGTGEDALFLPRYTNNSPKIFVNLSEKGEWIHVAHTMDADGNVNGETRGYKNGSQVDSSTSTPSEPDNTSVPNTMQIGHIDGSFGLNFYGYLFDFRLYNRALSASEVQELYDVFGATSSHETVYKGPSPSSSPTASFESVSIPSGASATLEFLEDTNGDGTADNTDSIAMTDGQTDYTASGLAGSGEQALLVKLENTDLTVASTVEVPVDVTP